MKGFIRHLGVIDRKNQVHSVTFGPGVNVVTGKSSTGKSALIEIFDYCFGSSDFTIPQGVITRHAVVYFTVMKVQDTTLILARKDTDSLRRKAYFKEVLDDIVFNDVNKLSLEDFNEKEFQPLNQFKKDVGRRFGLVFTDIDTDPEARSRRPNNARAATPSIRSFTSFMLQHQNLVANKHAIFYRFDEKEKRDQVIDHLKCFLGFAKPEYFQLKQELFEWELKIKGLEFQLVRERARKIDLIKRVQIALDDYLSTSGTALGSASAEQLLTNPQESLELVRRIPILIEGASEANTELRRKVGEAHASAVVKRRSAAKKLLLVRDSIENIRRFRDRAEAVPIPKEEVITKSECPFCSQRYEELEVSANRLEEAILWLNDELERSFTLPSSLVEDERKLMQEILIIDDEIKEIQLRQKQLDLQDVELAKRRPQYELAVKAKVQIESVLENVIQDRPTTLQGEIERLRTDIKLRKELLAREHDVDRKMEEAEASINNFMAVWGPKFEFEKSFDPINLHFSLTDFDLWHQNPKGVDPEKVYLRAMGSGANWLYSHLTLFLAFQRLFCHQGASCLIPPILFLDQPSQVYFPSVLDSSSEFDAVEISKVDPSRGSRLVDDDIAAVTNMYTRLVEFCADTERNEGIEPQIIVTDHADGLKLDGKVSFESLVNGRRWRTRGLIEPVETTG